MPEAPLTAPRRPLNDAEQLILKAALSVFRPRRHATIADWIRAQKIRIKSEQNSALAGTYFDPDQTPAVARLLHSFYEPEGPNVPNVMVILKDSQSGATTNFASLMGWLVESRPGNMAYWTDIGANVYSAVDEKFRPFFEGVPAMRKSMEEREASQRILKKTLPGMSVTFMSAGSDSSFKQRTLTYCVLDECAGHAPINGQTTLDLAIARTTTEADAKVLAFSKPNACISTQTDEDGNISVRSGQHSGDWFHEAYLAGTQERYMVPCPHCGFSQELRAENLIYDHCQEELEAGMKYWNQARILNEAYMLCANADCPDGKILDRHRRAMMLAGQWVPTPREDREMKELFPTARPRWRSARHNAFLSLFPNLSFGALALEHLAARNNRAKERAFLNERCGLPYTPERSREMRSPAMLTRLIPGNVGSGVPTVPGYRRLFLTDIVPPEEQERRVSRRTLRLPKELGSPPLIGITCDAQKAFFKWCLWAYKPVDDFLEERGEDLRFWGVEAEPWCLDWGYAHSVEEFDRIRAAPIELWDGTPRGIDYVMMDCRTPADQLLKMCLDRQDTRPPIFPVWGESDTNAAAVRLGPAWQYAHAVKGTGVEISVIHQHHSHWAEETMVRRIENANLASQDTSSPPFRFPPQMAEDQSFMREILNQMPIQEMDKHGRFKPIIWGPAKEMLKDDFFDCCKYALILWFALAFNLPTRASRVA